MPPITLPRQVVEEAVEALELAVRQNSHDMLMTGEELRECEASLASLRSVLAESKAVEPAPQSDQAMEVLRELVAAENYSRPDWSFRLEDAFIRARALVEGQTAQPESVDVAAPQTELETKAQAIYEGWSTQAGYVPWVPGGNSHKQGEARDLARAAIAAAPPTGTQGEQG